MERGTVLSLTRVAAGRGRPSQIGMTRTSLARNGHYGCTLDRPDYPRRNLDGWTSHPGSSYWYDDATRIGAAAQGGGGPEARQHSRKRAARGADRRHRATARDGGNDGGRTASADD